jgi:hypothetical protein
MLTCHYICLYCIFHILYGMECCFQICDKTINPLQIWRRGHEFCIQVMWKKWHSIANLNYCFFRYYYHCLSYCHLLEKFNICIQLMLSNWWIFHLNFLLAIDKALDAQFLPRVEWHELTRTISTSIISSWYPLGTQQSTSNLNWCWCMDWKVHVTLQVWWWNNFIGVAMVMDISNNQHCIHQMLSQHLLIYLSATKFI